MDQFPNEGQALSGPFKVPSNVLKKQYFYGNVTKDLVIEPLKINTFGQKISYRNTGSNTASSGANEIKSEVKEKRKPIVRKNSKPKQQVIEINELVMCANVK